MGDSHFVMFVAKTEVVITLSVSLMAILLIVEPVFIFGWYNLGPAVYVQVVVDAAVGVGTSEV